MGAHWSTLSAEDLAAVVRRFGVAYEPYALFIEENGVNGGTLRTLAEEGAAGPFSEKGGFNSVFSEIAEVVGMASVKKWVHRLRLLQEVQKSETCHPLPNQPDEEVVAEAQRWAQQLAEQATITTADTSATAPGSRNCWRRSNSSTSSSTCSPQITKTKRRKPADSDDASGATPTKQTVSAFRKRKIESDSDSDEDDIPESGTATTGTTTPGTISHVTNTQTNRID